MCCPVYRDKDHAKYLSLYCPCIVVSTVFAELPAHHYACATFNDACLLHVERKPSRVGDIVFVLSHLPVPVVLKPVHLVNPDSIPDLITEGALCACALQRNINDSEKMVLLKKYISTSGPVKLSDVLRYWHYLNVIVPAHCKVLT